MSFEDNDFCIVREADGYPIYDLEIDRRYSSPDADFFILFHANVTYVPFHAIDDEHDGDDGLSFHDYEGQEINMTVATRRDFFVREERSCSVISNMVSDLEVPMEIQERLEGDITDGARTILRAEHNADRESLAIDIDIGVVVLREPEDFETSMNVDGNDDDNDGDEASACGSLVMSMEGLEKVKVEELGFGEQCVICLEEFGGVGSESEATRLPCLHVFHGGCIFGWLKKSRACPLCRFEMF